MTQADLNSAFGRVEPDEKSTPRPEFKPLPLLVTGACLFVSGYFVPIWQFALGLQIFGATTLLFALGLYAFLGKAQRQSDQLHAAVASMIENDPVACFVCDNETFVLSANKAAAHSIEKEERPRLSSAFLDTFANPNEVLFRLQARAQSNGAAREDIVTRRGHVRLSVNQIDEETYLWRIEQIEEKPLSGGTPTKALPMMTVGPSGTILYMNDGFRKLLGKRLRTLEQVFYDLPLRSGRLHEFRGAAGRISALVAVIEVSGGRSEVFLLPAVAGNPVSPFSAKWDAIEDLPVPLLKVATTGELLTSNREARNLLGKVEEGARLSDHLEGLGRPMVDWLQEVGSGRSDGDVQFLRTIGDRPDLFVQVSLRPAGDERDRHLVAVLSDMTEFKSLEAQFVQSQKMQAIGQLAGGVAHDFNNLLTAISGHCDLLLLRHDQGDQNYSDLIQIHQNANRAASLVGQLLAFSRKQNLRLEILDLRNALSDLTHLLNRLVGEKVTLILNHDPALKTIRADKRQLEQVIMNLVVNARDAMPSGGSIRVETENITLQSAVERDRATLPKGDYVLIKVIDEGHGIPKDKISKIFEPFYTTKRTGEGTGLGLSTAYGIVKQTGGFIFAESEVNVGTVFWLYFPVCEKPAQPFELEDDQVVLGGAPQNSFATLKLEKEMSVEADLTQVTGVVLLVEDEAPVRAFASRALRLRGFTVLEADSAESALELLTDDALHIDIFVSDVIMPGRDGPSWVREALKTRPDTKVVFVSGYAEESFGENQSLIPNSVFLPKPFSLNELTSTVQGQLH